jgi:hypothetical protein
MVHPQDALLGGLLPRHPPDHAGRIDPQVRHLRIRTARLTSPRIFYWFGVHFDRALLVQAAVMIVMQSLLLHVALSNRASASGITPPFSTAAASSPDAFDADIPRPYNFWRWRTAAPFWHTLAYLTAALVSLQLLFGGFAFFAPSLGAVALAV